MKIGDFIIMKPEYRFQGHIYKILEIYKYGKIIIFNINENHIVRDNEDLRIDKFQLATEEEIAKAIAERMIL